MKTEIYLEEQLQKHPSMSPQDIVKLCYQAVFGAEHLLEDSEKARAYLSEEMDSVTAEDGELYEKISSGTIRVNLRVWKKRGLPTEWLFNMFAYSLKKSTRENEAFLCVIREAERLIASADVSFSLAEWEKYIEEYISDGIRAVSHSEEYRRAEKPSYRIVDASFIRIFPVLEKINEIRKRPAVIALDGRAASGKTTLSVLLSAVLDADVIHMDDFFVPLDLRTAERFLTPGENIHHERFSMEVLPFITDEGPFSYRIFDCSKMDYNGMREIGTKPFRIVEGSYSCHPVFGEYADVTVFSDVAYEEQLRRIRNRNGERLLSMFVDRWIPLEEEYFKAFEIQKKADITV